MKTSLYLVLSLIFAFWAQITRSTRHWNYLSATTHSSLATQYSIPFPSQLEAAWNADGSNTTACPLPPMKTTQLEITYQTPTTTNTYVGTCEMQCIIGSTPKLTFPSTTSHTMWYIEFELQFLNQWLPTDTLTIETASNLWTFSGIDSTTFPTNAAPNACGYYHDMYHNIVRGLTINSAPSDYLKIYKSPNTTNATFGIWNLTIYGADRTPEDVAEICLLPSATGTFGNWPICPCPIPQYLDSSGVCTIPANCEVAFGNNECIICKAPMVKDIYGHCISTTTCTATAPFQPTQPSGLCWCPLGEYMLDNSTCGTSCVPPWTFSYTLSGQATCKFPCAAGQYYKSTGVCVYACPAPFQIYSVSTIESYCVLPCTGTQWYSFVTGNCETSCNYPNYENIEDQTLRFCSPCPSGQYMSSGGCENCEANCECGGTSSCEFCLSTAYTLADGSCTSSCDSPYYWYLQGTTLYCSKPYPNKQVIGQAASAQTSSQIALSVASNLQAFAGAVASSLTIITLNKMLYYTRYIDIKNRPADLTYFYEKTLRDPSMDYAIPIPSGMEKSFSQRKIPANFAEYNVKSSFMLGYWSTLNTLIYISVVIGVLAFVQKRLQGKRSKVAKVVDEIQKVLKYNYLLMMFSSSLNDVFLYGFLDLSTEQWTGLDVLSSLLAIIFFGFAFAMVGFTVYIVHQSMQLRKKISPEGNEDPQKEFLEKWSSVSFLFEDFRRDNYIAHSYMLIFFLRAIVYNMIDVLAYHSPKLQCLIITLISLGMLMIILLVKPFKTIYMMIEFGIYETIILLVNLGLLYLSLTDDGRLTTSRNTVYRSQAADAIIYMFLVFSFTGIFFAIVHLGITIRNVIVESKRKMIERRKSLKLQKAKSDLPLKLEDLNPEDTPTTSKGLLLGDSSSRAFRRDTTDTFANTPTTKISPTPESKFSRLKSKWMREKFDDSPIIRKFDTEIQQRNDS